MQYLVFSLPEHLANHVWLTPIDPRSDALGVYGVPVTFGSALEVIAWPGGLLEYCDTADLIELRRVVAAELARRNPGRDTRVVGVGEIQREFGRAVIEELAELPEEADAAALVDGKPPQ